MSEAESDMNGADAGVLLRPAQADDAAAIARLATQLGYPTTTAQAAARLQRLLPLAGHHVLVAEVAGEVAGWAHVEQRLNLESGAGAELMGLVVDERHRRLKLGSKLVRAVEQWARAAGLANLTVRSNVVRAASHSFYRQLGYTVVKTQHVYRKGLDAH